MKALTSYLYSVFPDVFTDEFRKLTSINISPCFDVSWDVFNHSSEENIIKWNATDSDPVKCLIELFPILGLDEELVLQRLDIEVLQDLTSRLRAEYTEEYSADLSRQLANAPAPDKLPTKRFTTSGFQIVYCSGQALETPGEGQSQRNFSLSPSFSTFFHLWNFHSIIESLRRQ